MSAEYKINGPGLTTEQRHTLTEALTKIGVPFDAGWRFNILPDSAWYALQRIEGSASNGDWRDDPVARVTTIRGGVLSGSGLDKILEKAVGKLIPKPPQPFQASVSEQQRRVDDYLAHHQHQPQSDSAPQQQQRRERRRLDKKKCLRIRVTKQMAVELKIIADRERRTVNSLVAKVLYDFTHKHESTVSGIYPIIWKHHRPGVLIRSRVDQETLALLRSKTFRGASLSKYGAKILTQYLIEQSNLVGKHPARYSNEFFVQRTQDFLVRRGLIAPGAVEDAGKETGTFRSHLQPESS